METFNLANIYSAAENVKGMRSRNELLDQQKQMDSVLRTTAQKSMDPKTGELDMQKFTNDLAAAGYADQAQEFRAKYVDTLSRTAQYVNAIIPRLNAGTYPAVKQQLEKAGMVPAGYMPEQFDSAWVEQQMAALNGKLKETEQWGPLTQVPGAEEGTLGQTNLSTNEVRVPVKPAAPEKPTAQWKTLTPDEITAAGLPPGSSAERNTQTGETRVLSKRDTTASLSQKDATTAKMKLNTVQLARAQLKAVKEAFDQGRGGMGPNAFGPGQGVLPTPAGKLFDSRVDQMRSTLTALTRVPGVGAMSDYETKLDQSKFPERSAWESVTADKIRGLEDMLALIENGYTGLLSGGTAQPEQPQTPATPSGGPTVGTVEGGYRFKGGDPSKQENWEPVQ